MIELEKPLAKPLKSSAIEADFVTDLAKREVYVSNFGDKISQIQDTDAGIFEILAILTEWRMYLGIKEEPTAQENLFNRDFMVKNYGDWTPEMIRLAINYSLKGILKVDTKPYGSFSPLYISTILNAYKKHNDGIVNEILRAEHLKKTQVKNEGKTLQPDEKIASRKIFLNQFFLAINTEHPTPDTPQDTAWNFLVNNGLIDPAPIQKILANKEMEWRLATDAAADVLYPGADQSARHSKMETMIGYCLEHPVDIEEFSNEQIML